MRRVLVLEAHPDPHSYGTALADAYAEGAAAAGAEVRRIALRDLAFDPILHHGFREAQPWEPDLTQTWEAIQAAWDKDLTAAKLECAYRLLTPVMSLIHDKNGGNNFTLPHTGLRKAMREDGWDI